MANILTKIKDFFMSLLQVKGDLSVDTSNVFVDGKQADLSICHIAADAYHDLVFKNECLSNVIYFVEDDKHSMYGQRVTDVAEPVEPNDAVTLKYLEEHFMKKDAKLSGDYATKADVSATCKSMMADILKKVTSLIG